MCICGVLVWMVNLSAIDFEEMELCDSSFSSIQMIVVNEQKGCFYEERFSNVGV